MQVQKAAPDGKPMVDAQGKPVMDTVADQPLRKAQSPHRK